ncbi:hypothetical protein IWX75_000797 [Arthrobacter sp. CAN_A6]
MPTARHSPAAACPGAASEAGGDDERIAFHAIGGEEGVSCRDTPLTRALLRQRRQFQCTRTALLPRREAPPRPTDPAPRFSPTTILANPDSHRPRFLRTPVLADLSAGGRWFYGPRILHTPALEDPLPEGPTKRPRVHRFSRHWPPRGCVGPRHAAC